MRPAVPACAALLAVWTAGTAGSSPPSPRDLLQSVARFSAAEWAAVERGDPVSKLLDTDAREIAVAGAVKATGSRDRLAARARDLDRLKNAAVLDVGRFGARPAASDLQRLAFDDHNLDLRACRPGDCTVRLDAADIARFHREVSWTGPDWRTQSAGVWRTVLAGHAAAYAAKGRAALPAYVNKPEPLSVASELSGLTAEYAFLREYAPEFHAYLQDLGPRPPAGAEQVLYWTREDFGIRPIVRLSHQVIQAMPAATVIAVNQIYADHYLDAALTVTLALDAGRDVYVISIGRARTRSLSGFLRRFARSTVQSRSRDALRHSLAAIRTAIEGR